MEDRHRIAVVDDNGDNRMLLKAMLSKQFTVDLYSDGESALLGMVDTPPGVVLLDISMPYMDGPTVLAKMRRDAALKDLPVVALTAHAMCGDRERFLALGFSAYVSKPIVDWDSLRETLAALLAG